MASTVDTHKLKAKLFVKSFDFDPNGTDPVDVGWVATKEYSGFLFACFRSVGTGSVAAFSILGNTEADGSGTDVTIKSHAIGSAPDAVGDQIFLEVTEEEIASVAAAAGVSIKGISASVDLATGTDECVVTYVFEGKRAYLNQTADIIA